MIIGGAFGKIVESLVKDVVMPPIGLALGKVSFANMYKVLKEGDSPNPAGMPYDEALKVKGAVLLGYGNWINHVISFLIVAFCVFVLVKMVNKLYPPPKPADPEKPAQEKLLEEIRDLLKKA